MKHSSNDSGLTAKRSYRLLAAGLTAILMAVSPLGYSQDYARISERTLMGTARYVGMGGAMSAIGGDPSSVMDNTACLGLYRRMEMLITFDHTIAPATSVAGRVSQFMAPQASVVFSVPSFRATEHEGIQYHNFMLSYQRVHSFNRSLAPSSTDQPSLGYLFAYADGNLGIPYTADPYNVYNDLRLEERGYVNEFAIDWATNIANKWYAGLGLRIHSFSFSSEGDYFESFNYKNAQQETYYNRSRTSVFINGAGCSLSAGFIGRPLSWLRLGVGLQTPSLGSLTLSTSGTFDALRDSLRWSDAPNLSSDLSDFHMPLHLSTSVAFQIDRYAMIALQYDYRYSKYTNHDHSLRAGLELVPITGLYINAGYVFESNFAQARVVDYDKTLDRQDTYFWHQRWQQYISGGIGFRGRYIIAQAAYQYRMHRAQLFAHEAAAPYDINQDFHRIVVTIGWHNN